MRAKRPTARCDNWDPSLLRSTIGALGNMYFRMQLDGKPIEATLGSGDILTSLCANVAKRLYDWTIIRLGSNLQLLLREKRRRSFARRISVLQV
jgi:hypothetical protein